MKAEKKNWYEIWPDVERKDWTPPIDTAIKGYRIGSRMYRLSYPVYAEKGAKVVVHPKKGVEVNGVFFKRKVRAWKPKGCVIGWVPKRLKIAVFFERGRLWHPGHKDHGKDTSGWLAADVRGYNVGQGDDPLDAIRSLLLTCGMNNEMAQQEKRKGLKVTRQMHHLDPEVQKDLREMEEKARKTGIILDGVLVPPMKIIEQQLRRRKRA